MENIIALVDGLLNEAVRQNASDIHIEPLDSALRVRFRIDGLLRTVRQLDLKQHGAVLSRIKIMAGLDIAERRLPQDGRMELIREGRTIDLRISTLPTIRGEKAVIRILDKRGDFLKLTGLNFTAENLALYQKLYRAAYGMVLVTGPTGSGKSTTLYAALQELNDGAANIITIEDPVEYKLDGVNQVAVNNKAGLTFASGLRSIVRQDPNIIMVGEVRDAETARITVQAALTGHLVFSTLHTNNAVGAVSRLIDMGIEPFLLTSALRGILAQRLVRCICPHCAEEYAASYGERQFLGVEAGNLSLKRGRGCGHCSGTGYSGRMAVQEILPITEEMSTLILRGAPEREILAAGRIAGYKSLREDGVTKVLAGQTTVAELLRALDC